MMVQNYSTVTFLKPIGEVVPTMLNENTVIPMML